jgi:hypothetical protein
MAKFQELHTWQQKQVENKRFTSLAATQRFLAGELQTCESHVRQWTYGVRAVPYKYHRRLAELTFLSPDLFEATHQ